MTPDSPLVSHVFPSPNYNVRKDGMNPNMVLLHYTGMDNTLEAAKLLCNPEAEVSAHYLVFEDGVIWQLIPETKRAWHAGKGMWKKNSDINSCSIGIEIANRGHNYPDQDPEPPEFPEIQMKSVAHLVKDIMTRWKIAPERLLGHSDIAPERKTDPGEKFPWKFLFQADLGFWVEPVSLINGPLLQKGDQGNSIFRLQNDLCTFGYNVPISGLFDEQTYLVVQAFQRHFRPQRVDGRADQSTLLTLQKLLILSL